MTAFHPLPPHKAIDLMAAAGMPHTARLLRDYAAAGLVKSYALLVETIEVDGRQSIVRGGAVPTDLWQRMIRDGVDDDVWTGGTVRLASADLIWGLPAINITGIGFNPGDVERLVAQHRCEQPKAKRAVATLPPPRSLDQPAANAATPAPPRPRRAADASVLTPGKLLVTIAEAGAALGCGRTKVNELMNAGRLERRDIDGGVRITVESVRAVAGIER